MQRIRVRAGAIVALLASLGVCRSAQAQPGDIEVITRAAVMYRDPVDIQAVEAVCGRCHAAEMYLKVPRSYLRWEEVFARMSKHGASGSPDQLNSVIRFVDRNLTVLNLNTSLAEELEAVLQITPEVSAVILKRRESKPLRRVQDLDGIEGLNREVIRKREALGLLQF
jgi:hypothetical protein